MVRRNPPIFVYSQHEFAAIVPRGAGEAVCIDCHTERGACPAARSEAMALE